MKRIYYIVTIVVIIVIVTAYLFTRFSILKTDDPKPDLSKSESPLDLRPLIIAKLQELVKQSSDGLYTLSVEQIEPDVLNSAVNIKNAEFTTDSSALKNLDSLKKGPDDIFNFSFRGLRITGININDFLHRKNIDIDSIFVSQPAIKVYHGPKPYNKAERERANSLTLYMKLQAGLKHLGVKSIIVENGSLTHTNAAQKARVQKFNNIGIQISDLLFDSTTEYDKSRFLFSKEVLLSCKNYLARTPDSLYFFKVGSISVNAAKHSLTGTQVALVPRGTKREFSKKISYRGDRFDVRIPKVVFSNIDWWALINNESFTSEKADVYNAEVKNYVDRSKPLDPNKKLNNFPQQLLMRTPLKINIAKLSVHHSKTIYEEKEPKIARSGTVYFDNINGAFENITNVPAAIQKNNFASFTGSCLFMHSVAFSALFKFDLVKYKTGDFSVSIRTGSMDSTVINPIAEPMGLFSFKSGELQQASGYVAGNNFSSTTNVELLYKDLHIIPLKIDKNDSTNLKPKTFTSFIANTFLIKDANPSKGEEVRKPTVVRERNHDESYFNFVWKNILAGILKTIGIPLKYMNQ